MQNRGYSDSLKVREIEVKLAQAELEVKGKKDEIEVLKKYTKAMELKTLEGNLKAAEADDAANQERAVLDAKRRDLAKSEYELCVIKSEKSASFVASSMAASIRTTISAGVPAGATITA